MMTRFLALIFRRLNRNRLCAAQDGGTMTYVLSMMMMT
jgi:hypothetical protein